MRSVERIFAALFGLLLIGIGIYAALFPAVEPVWGYIGGVLLTVLGGNAINTALKDKRPWIFLIASLP